MSEPRPPCKPAEPGGARSSGALLLLDPATPAGAALRTTLAAVLAMALAFALHVEVPALAVVYVLARGNAGAVTMVLGSIGGSAAALVLLALFDQSRLAFSLALFLLTTVATYAALGRRFPYAYVQALLSFLVLVGQGLDRPDAAVRHAFYDLANVLVAAFAAFVAGATQPVTIARQLQSTLATALRGAAALLQGGGGPASVVRLELLARRRRVLLAASWPTRQVSRARRRAFAAACDATDRLVEHALAIGALARACGHAGDPGAEPLPTALSRALDEVASTIEPRRGPVMADGRTQGRRGARGRGRGPAHVRRCGSVLAALDTGARRALAEIAVLAPFLAPGSGSPPDVGRDRRAAAARRVHLVVDRFRLRHAVKSGVSYLLVLWAWVAADWGAIVPALVVSVLVATLATPLGATLRKAVLRVAGVLAGGLAGLLVAVVLLPFISTLPAICVVAGIALLGFLWVQQHHERLAFASLQAAIAFTLTLVHGTGPSPSWREPLESLIGLAFGITVVVVVMHAVWPIDAISSAHGALASLLENAGRRGAAVLGRIARGAPVRTEDVEAIRERAHAVAEREHAAGFAHEVALYGAQFGRPSAHLAELVRLIVELDALLFLLELPRRPPADALPGELAREIGALGALLEQSCRAVATEVATLPGTTPALDGGPPVAGLEARTRALATRVAHAPDLRVPVQLLCDAAQLLSAVRRELERPAHRDPRLRAA